MDNTCDDGGCRQHEPSHIEEWPADGLESAPNCPVCGNQKRTLLYDGLTDRVFKVAPGKWTLYRCGQCASAWLDPRPTRETIMLAYANYYTHLSERTSDLSRESKLRFILRKLLNDYRNTRYGLRRNPVNVFGRSIIPLIPPLRAAIDAGYRHLPSLPIGGGRLLDVGCGNGEFLQLAIEMGWRAEGIDFDMQAVGAARASSLNVVCGCIEDFKEKSGQFDVITVSHVIEHVHDPASLLVQVHRLLKPDGMLWIETPNIDSFGARKFGRNWRGIEPPRHLQLFNIKSLGFLLKSIGFGDLQQQWHSLTTFDIFASSEAIVTDSMVNQTKHCRRISLTSMYSELLEMIARNGREFLTLIVRKRV